MPTAGAVIDRYLAPLAALPKMAACLRLSHRVEGVSREGFDKSRTQGRDLAPFVIRARTAQGTREFKASAVIDASGTWGQANPLGASGLPALGESEQRARIAYGMPDVLGRDRARYAGKRVLVAGAGHSAAGSLLALAKLAADVPGTRIVWTIRGRDFSRIFGGGENDGLAARGALGRRLKALAESGGLEVVTGFRTETVRGSGAHLVVEGRMVDGTANRIEGIEEIIVAAGGRPDLAITSELRLKLDAWIESTEQLAPLIDPNVHSCGTVRPHGHRELAHPEPRFYAIGAKSYGRAPNFLLATGHEQARSVVAALAGDVVAADDVQLVLPETGVCSTQFDEASSGCCSTEPEKPQETAEAILPAKSGCASSSCAAPGKKAALPEIKVAAASGCCGGPPVKRTDACCLADETARDEKAQAL